MTTILQQASDALSRNDADTLDRLCAEAGTCSMRPADMVEYAALLSVLRRQVIAARANIVLRRRLHPTPLELPWVP